MAVDSMQFRSALGHFGSGVTVVTMAHEAQKSGLTVSAFCSVSLTPPYVLVCIDKRSSTLELIRKSQAFAVNILTQDQVSISNHFASKSEDKMSGIPHHLGILGTPLLDGTQAYLECKVTQEIDAGDHFIYLGEVEDAGVDEGKSPLLYFHGKYGSFTPLD
jgi:3-hydroxy-9,10-secoandrosta-1,3,5(10)-triene-9,17-dione monooxygenase reductase component